MMIAKTWSLLDEQFLVFGVDASSGDQTSS